MKTIITIIIFTLAFCFVNAQSSKQSEDKDLKRASESRTLERKTDTNVQSNSPTHAKQEGDKRGTLRSLDVAGDNSGNSATHTRQIDSERVIRTASPVEDKSGASMRKNTELIPIERIPEAQKNLE